MRGIRSRPDAGVTRMYTGTAGQVENCQVGVSPKPESVSAVQAMFGDSCAFPGRLGDLRKRNRYHTGIPSPEVIEDVASGGEAGADYVLVNRTDDA